MKKIICAVLTLIIIACAFTACDIKIPLINEETTEESTTESTTAAPDFDAWGRSYSDYLLSVIGGNANLAGYCYEVEDSRFLIEDLDADGVPELLISGGEQDASKVDIHFFDGYETRYAGSSGTKGSISFVEGAGLIYTYEVLDTQETHTVDYYDGGTVKQLWQGITVASDKDLVPVDCTKDYDEGEVEFFTSDAETPASAEDYRKEFTLNVPKETETAGRNGHPLTEENAVAVKTGADFSDEIKDDKDSKAYAEVLPLGEAAAAYKKLLNEKVLSETGENPGFGFADIDGDGEPELFISQGESETSAVEIYGFDGESAVLLCTSGSLGATGINPDEGIIAGEYKSEQSSSAIVYKLEDGSCTAVWNGETLTGDDSDTEYISDGETVSEEEYREAYDGYFSDLIEIGRDAHALTESEITSVLG